MQKEISYIRLKKRFPIKSLKIAHTPLPPISENICQNEKKFVVGSTIKQNSNQPNFKPDRTTSFFGMVSLEKLCPVCMYTYTYTLYINNIHNINNMDSNSSTDNE